MEGPVSTGQEGKLYLGAYLGSFEETFRARLVPNEFHLNSTIFGSFTVGNLADFVILSALYRYRKCYSVLSTRRRAVHLPVFPHDRDAGEVRVKRCNIITLDLAELESCALARSVLKVSF